MIVAVVLVDVIEVVVVVVGVEVLVVVDVRGTPHRRPLNI